MTDILQQRGRWRVFTTPSTLFFTGWVMLPSNISDETVFSGIRKKEEKQKRKSLSFRMGFVFLFFCCTCSGGWAQQNPGSSPLPHDFFKQFLPLPEDAPRTIQNPYHADALWKLWAVDPSPIVFNTPRFKGRFESLKEDNYPVPLFNDEPGAPVSFQRAGVTSMAGFFDDVYLSLDNGHTNLGYPPGNIFLNAGKMATAQEYRIRFQLGVNFTSQSYSGRGRAIVDDLLNVLNTEKNFFFANCIRATPAHNSFKDTREDAVTDLYDGSYGSSYQAIGQSGSEVHALSKMMIAGASMPRTIKDLLKKNGSYAITLLTLFKMALPYADEDGKPLAFENELRHLPAYSSNGDPVHKHFCSANVHFYGYDEDLHVWEMARLAREMEIAPPVTVITLAGFRIKTPGKILTERAVVGKRIKSMGLTSIRIWGEPGETLEAVVDLRKSYDLQGQDLQYTCQNLYPNQKNTIIQTVAPGIFSVKVEHDESLPKGRIPIICTVRNQGEIPGNPVFLNFYWPGANELSDYGLPKRIVKKRGLRRLPVTVNKRPIVVTNFVGDTIACSPGDVVTFTISGIDPEGYPVTVYRRLGQSGTVSDGEFKVKISKKAQDRIEPVHFLFSDGTGGYSGTQIKLCIGKAQDVLDNNWSVSLLGQASLHSQVAQEGVYFNFTGGTAVKSIREVQGLFVFQKFQGNIDLVAQIPGNPTQSALGLLLTNSLDYFSRSAFTGFFHGRVVARLHGSERKNKSRINFLPNTISDKPELFRIVTRNGYTGVFVSEDGVTWTQLDSMKIKWFRQTYAGFLYGGGDDSVIGRWVKPEVPLVLVHPIGARKDKKGNYHAPLQLEVQSPKGFVSYYTLDGTEPTRESLEAQGILELTHPGKYQLRLASFEQNKAVGTTVVFYSVVSRKK